MCGNLPPCDQHSFLQAICETLVLLFESDAACTYRSKSCSEAVYITILKQEDGEGEKGVTIWQKSTDNSLLDCYCSRVRLQSLTQAACNPGICLSVTPEAAIIEALPSSSKCNRLLQHKKITAACI